MVYCCAVAPQSPFQTLVATEEKKRSQSSVKSTFYYSLMAWRERIGTDRKEGRDEKTGKERRRKGGYSGLFCPTRLF